MSDQGDKVRARLEKRWPKINSPAPQTVEIDGRTWAKVQAARPWRPRSVGDVLIGEFIGHSVRAGATGSYGVATLRTEVGTLTISGVVIRSLVEAADVPKGATVRVVYNGEQTGPAGRTWRDFDLFVAVEMPESEAR
jgi:hypothetical protein